MPKPDFKGLSGFGLKRVYGLQCRRANAHMEHAMKKAIVFSNRYDALRIRLIRTKTTFPFLSVAICALLTLC